MVKRGLVQAENVRVAALMIGMTAGAGVAANLVRLAMKTAASIDVTCRVLMAVETQRILLGAVKWLVT